VDNLQSVLYFLREVFYAAGMLELNLEKGRRWRLLLPILGRKQDGFDTSSQGTDELFLDASDCGDAPSK
jgi:hypothetical protein